MLLRITPTQERARCLWLLLRRLLQNLCSNIANFRKLYIWNYLRRLCIHIWMIAQVIDPTRVIAKGQHILYQWCNLPLLRKIAENWSWIIEIYFCQGAKLQIDNLVLSLVQDTIKQRQDSSVNLKLIPFDESSWLDTWFILMAWIQRHYNRVIKWQRTFVENGMNCIFQMV